MCNNDLFNLPVSILLTFYSTYIMYTRVFKRVYILHTTIGVQTDSKINRQETKNELCFF